MNVDQLAVNNVELVPTTWEQCIINDKIQLAELIRIYLDSHPDTKGIVLEIGGYKTPATLYSNPITDNYLTIVCDNIPTTNLSAALGSYYGNAQPPNNWLYFNGDANDVVDVSRNKISAICLFFPGIDPSKRDDSRVALVKNILSFDPDVYVLVTTEHKPQDVAKYLLYVTRAKTKFWQMSGPQSRLTHMDYANYHKLFPMTYYSRLMQDFQIDVMEINPQNRLLFKPNGHTVDSLTNLPD